MRGIQDKLDPYKQLTTFKQKMRFGNDSAGNGYKNHSNKSEGKGGKRKIE